MIAYLEGKIVKKLERSLIIANEKVGYEVFVKSSIYEQSGEDDQITFYIHSHIRESEITLYGFTSSEELLFFRQIISVNGIGPRTGLEFLCLPIEQLQGAILQKDISFICQVPGIGKKTAERLILDLKDKVNPAHAHAKTERKHQNIHDEVLVALQNLGYQKYDVKKVLDRLPENIVQTEDIIKYFLQNI